MPRHKSAEKRARQGETRALRNRAARTRIRGATKELRHATDPEEAKKSLAECTSFLDRALKKSVMHRRAVDRTKSRLAKLANKLTAPAKQQ
ncbi:MAG: 30S ribosomal protein S20 [Candidatus Eisenbacteria bacterium]|nr:30S ribosomal protein S20 [Candidatus Eisenbacteria bacterium]